MVGKRRTAEQIRAEIDLERGHVAAGIHDLGNDTLRAAKLAAVVVGLLTLGALIARRRRTRRRGR